MIEFHVIVTVDVRRGSRTAQTRTRGNRIFRMVSISRRIHNMISIEIPMCYHTFRCGIRKQNLSTLEQTDGSVRDDVTIRILAEWGGYPVVVVESVERQRMIVKMIYF